VSTTLKGFSMNVKVIAKMQNRNEKNHRMCRKSRNLYHFSASKACTQSGEDAGMFKWQPLEDISYNSGKEVEFMINSGYWSYALAKHC
jgi:hypothetical protein